MIAHPYAYSDVIGRLDRLGQGLKYLQEDVVRYLKDPGSVDLMIMASFVSMASSSLVDGVQKWIPQTVSVDPSLLHLLQTLQHWFPSLVDHDLVETWERVEGT